MTTTGAIRLAAALPAGWGEVPPWALPALATAVAVTELAVVHVTVAGHRWAFSLTEGAIAAALVVAPGAWTVPAALVGVAVAQRVRGRDRLKLQYNAAQVAASTALATLTAVALPRGVLAATAGMLVYWSANQVLSALPVALLCEMPVIRLVVQDAPLHLIHAAGTVSIGLLGGWLALTEPVAVVGLLVPTALLWLSYDEQTTRAAEARLFAELAHGQEQAANPSTDVLAAVVLTAAARLLDGADVEMVLLEHDGPVTYAGNAHGVRRRRVGADALDARWVLRALGARGVHTGVDAGRPFCAAVIGDPERPHAVLIARRSPGAAPFGRREIALVEVLVTQTQSWLAGTDLAASRPTLAEGTTRADQLSAAGGSHGGVTPALGVLRDAALRLARLAAAEPAVAVADIVEELHEVERAVASLLGAVVLAVEPGSVAALDPAAPLPGPRSPGRDQDWTTTGVLEAVRGLP